MEGKSLVSKILRRDDILKADDIVTESVEVREWGGVVKVRGLTGVERDDWEVSIVESRGRGNRKMNLQNMRARLVVRCVIDADGKRMFGDADAGALGAKSAAALSKLYDVAARLSGISSEDEEELAESFTSGDGAGSSST